MARPRRKRWIAMGAVLAVLLTWLGVRSAFGPSTSTGAGEEPSAETPADGGSTPTPAPARSEPSNAPSPPPTTSPSTTSTPPSSTPPSSTPAVLSPPQPDTAVPPAPPRAERAALRDRFRGLLAILGSGSPKEAVAARRQAEELDLSDDERSELERVCGALEIRLAGEIERTLGLARRGSVLAARTEIDALVPALESELGERLPASEEDVGASASLPRDLRVRYRAADGGLGEGAIVRATVREVSLRVSREDGVVYPTVAMTAVEPVLSTADHARALARAAFSADDDWLGRLWLLRLAELSR
ncbi:MAG: hypothetical protein AB7T19_16175 [Planctomycetota bacterium]